MKLIPIKAINYRTLQDVFLSFSKSCCTISGQNNAGKSPVLRLLSLLSSASRPAGRQAQASFLCISPPGFMKTGQILQVFNPRRVACGASPLDLPSHTGLLDKGGKLRIKGEGRMMFPASAFRRKLDSGRTRIIQKQKFTTRPFRSP